MNRPATDKARGTGAIRVGIAGFGTIGARVAQALDEGIEGLELAAVHTRRAAAAEQHIAKFRRPVPVCDVAGLIERSDVVVECVPTAAFESIAPAVLAAGKTLVTVSGAALMDRPELVELARRSGGRIILATGALLGLDAVRAAAEGRVHSVTMITRKPPKSLVDASYVVERGIDLSSLEQPLQLFAGSAREGARLFPANVNVAAALGLAGIGPDRTQLEIWADPALERNTHHIVVDADSARFELKIENVPSPEKPGTGRITALSVIACLRALGAPLRVGS